MPPRGISPSPRDEKNRRMRRVLERKVYLCFFNNGGSSTTVRVTITSASIRLQISFWLFYEPVSGTATPITDSWTLTRTILPPASSASEQDIDNAVAAGTAIPDFFSTASASLRYRAAVVTGTLAGGSSGHQVMLVRWEPTVQIPDAELESMFQNCDAQLQGAMPIL